MAELLQALDEAQQIEVCEEQSDPDQLFTGTKQEECPGKRRHPNHHVGPIDVSYAEDSQRRCKSFFKRRKTIFDKAHQLTSICGASVSLKLKSQGGQVYEYRSGEFQLEGEPGVPMITTIPQPGRPRKTPSSHGVDSQDDQESVATPPFKPLAGKKAPCAVCKKKDSWLACQKRGCTFWAHARCLGFVAMAPTDMSNVQFFCPKHIPSS